MKTLEQVLKYKPKCIDNRDLARLLDFIPLENWISLGVEPEENFVKNFEPVPLTKEEILTKLELDTKFAFEKALNKRGISSYLMFQVISMWNWILENGLEESKFSPYYGLPLFKAVALKYGFQNPIGSDIGTEEKYNI